MARPSPIGEYDCGWRFARWSNWESMHSQLPRCVRAHEAGSSRAGWPRCQLRRSLFRVRPLGEDSLSLFRLAFPDGQVAVLCVSNYWRKPTYLGVLETILREPPPSLQVCGYQERTQCGQKNRHRHQRTVLASWLPVARGEQLRKHSVQHAHGLRMRGVSLHITSYVYL